MVTESQEFMLTKSTIVKTNIATIITIIVMTIGGYVWFDEKIDKISERLAVIENSVNDRWRREDMSTLWTEFIKRNPELDIPTLEDVGR
jgi:hypothetical protein